ncbi:hypothetical protein [uncultured Dysosmobacter sp.]|uniref:hypothetical protein n=1 Tax=uncultured Dysosmobacter sp. TaxID=2591384 RepID=UPI002605F0C9|nr:hypothetical protein [uncultured Dysosmobacter sp.]
MYIYPNNLKAKPKMWLWELRSLALIGVGLILSVLALANGLSGLPLIVTVIYGFLSIKVEDTSVLDFLRFAANFLILKQQYFEWEQHYENE